MKGRIIENQNLKDNNFLNYFNDIARKYKITDLNLKDFDKKKFEEIDDLPF